MTILKVKRIKNKQKIEFVAKKRFFVHIYKGFVKRKKIKLDQTQLVIFSEPKISENDRAFVKNRLSVRKCPLRAFLTIQTFFY